MRIGDDECAYCGRSFTKKWSTLRNGDPGDSVHSMQLAMLEAEEFFESFIELYHKTQKRGKHLSNKSIRRVVEASASGSRAYKQFIAKLVVNMFESIVETERQSNRILDKLHRT